MVMRRALNVLAAAVVVLSTALPALPQITTGLVSGSVKDAQGAVIPGATIVLVNEAQGTKSVPSLTSETGDFVFPNVTPDTYTVEATLPGFKTTTRKGVKVSGGDRIAVPALVLEVGGGAETVSVFDEAPIVQTSSGERSFAIATEQIENLPINHGNFTSLTALTPCPRAALESAAPARTTS